MIDKTTGTLVRSSPITCGDTSEIMCVCFSISKKLLFCGHKSGVLSAWQPDSQNIISIAGLSKFHDGVRIGLINNRRSIEYI